MDIEEIIKELSKKRKVFHSEKDFQLALAWAIKEKHSNAEVHLEYCTKEEPRMYIDILVKIDNEEYPIELKYKTRKIEMKDGGQEYRLKDQSAQDHGRYGYLNDISRIEKLPKEMENFKKGYAIFLTNDQSYWNESNRAKYSKEFYIYDGLKKKGKMSWVGTPSEGTINGRAKEIELINEYNIAWKDYSILDDKSRNNTMKYLILAIPPQ